MYKPEEQAHSKSKYNNRHFFESTPYNHILKKKTKGKKLAELHLDENLRIIDYDEDIQQFIYITPDDIGRPIFHFATTFRYERLVHDVQFCISNNTEHQLLFQLQASILYVLKIIPFCQNNKKLVRLVFYKSANQETLDNTLSSINNKCSKTFGTCNDVIFAVNIVC